MFAVIEAGVDHERAVGGAIKPKALNGSDASFFKNRPLAPGLAAVGSDQQKRITWRALQVGAGNPAILKIDELDLIETRGVNAGLRFGPRAPAVFGCEQDRVERRHRRMKISRDEKFGAHCLHVRELEINGTRIVFRTTESGGLRFSRRALIDQPHGLAVVFERSLRAEQACTQQQQRWGMFKHRIGCLAPAGALRTS